MPEPQRPNVIRLSRGHDRDYLGRSQRCCPVCRQGVSPTVPYRNIEPHLDSIGADRCPGSDEPYRITLTTPAATVRRLTA